MADYPCPTCGKLNPIEAEVCWFCDTGLHASGSKPVPSQPSGESGSWLDSLGRKESDAISEAPSVETPNDPGNQSSEETGESPDWLTRIRMRAQTEQSVAPSASLPERESTPDWLRDVKGADFQAAAPAQPEWMDQPATPPVSENVDDVLPGAYPAATDKSTSEDDDWMNKVSSWSQPPQEAGDSQEQQLKNELPDNELPKSILETDSSTPNEDWLSGFQTDLGAAESPVDSVEKETTNSVGAEEDLPDWFKNLEAENTKTPQADETWMDTFQGHKSQDEAASLGEDEVLNETNIPVEAPSIPDWLGEAPLPTPTENAVVEDMPEWLKKAQPQPEPEEHKTIEEPPDWLNRFSSDTSTPVEDQPVPSETPDWLKNFADTGPIEEANSQPSFEVAPTEITDSSGSDMPLNKDWWSKVNQPEGQHISESEEKAPDWLSNVPTHVPEKDEVKLPYASQPA
ncbi:MAG: hypothetical protein HGA53_04445, partial [Anaerolineaceae bacterium]|nr:hypothetical protein [Anaerolineaceae bacterium]